MEQNPRPAAKQVVLMLIINGSYTKNVPCDKATTGLNGIETFFTYVLLFHNYGNVLAVLIFATRKLNIVFELESLHCSRS